MESNQEQPNQPKGSDRTTAIVASLIGIAVVLFVINQQLTKNKEQDIQNANNAVMNGNTPTNKNQPVVIDNANQPPEVITTTVDTSDWKTYRNEELGFEVKYSSVWQIQKTNQSLTLVIPNTEMRPLLDNLGAIDIYQGGSNTEKLLQDGKDKLSKIWLEELGVKKEVPEKKITSEGEIVYILGPFSPPSNMYEETYIVVSSDDVNIVLDGKFFGGDTVLLNKQMESVAMSLILVSGDDKVVNGDVCTSPPKERQEIGGTEYPISEKYKNLYWLGQLFTAYDCGEQRLNEFYGGLEKEYSLGSTLRLKQSSTNEFIIAVKKIGYQCVQQNVRDNDCMTWSLSDAVKIKELITLKKFYNIISSDDCVNCG